VSGPRAEYGRRLAEYEAAYAACERRHIRLGSVKLGVVAAGLVLLWFVAAQRAIEWEWLSVPVGAYVALAVAHELTLRKRRAAQTAIDLYRRGIARIEDKWSGSGATGEEFREAEHVYAEDLDLFGKGCLFQLLSTARLPMGEKRLADWLKHGSSRVAVLERQGLVAELREKLDLHRDLGITGQELRARIAPDTLIQWAERPTVLPGIAWRAVAILLSLCAAAGIAYYVEGGSKWPLLGVMTVEGVLLGWLRKKSKEAIAKIDCNAEGLQLFARILERFEKEEFRSARLREIGEELRGTGGAQRESSRKSAAPPQTRRVGASSGGATVVDERNGSSADHTEGPPQKAGPTKTSEAVQRLARVVYWVDAREDLIAKMAELPFLYTLQVAFAAEAWKRRFGAKLRRWMEIAGEMEALVSLGTYAYEHPGDVFPEFAEMGGAALFDGEALGHPLLADAQCVRNSVRLDSTTRVLLVSGSNMSGKSTLLRTVGINAVMAMAGAPVRAARLQMTPLAVGTRIRSGDSLQEGRSNFYTEILHIRRVFDLMKGRESKKQIPHPAKGAGIRDDSPVGTRAQGEVDVKPLLFLFDELLDGTNSHDRRIGAEKLLRTLVDGGAIGMVTTHDLALTEIGAAIGEGLRNVHFEDQVADGKMRFDYRLRDGVVAKSNAIALMRMIGLDV